MILNSKNILYLDALYRLRNFTRASEELYISQPAISAAITSMEKELGYKLLIRSSKGVSFTFEGEQLMLHVKRILKEMQDAERTMEELSVNTNQTLRLGVSPTLAVRLMPKIYSEFLPNWPNANVHLDEGSMHRHIHKVQEDMLDLSFNALPADSPPGVKTIRITQAEICAVLRPDHPLAQYSRIPLSAFHNQSIVMMDEKSMIRQLMLSAFEQEGVIPKIVSSHEQIFGIFQMVKFGGYVGFINTDPGHHSFTLTDSELLLRPLEQNIHLNVGFIMRADRHPNRIAHELIDFTKKSFSTPASLSSHM